MMVKFKMTEVKKLLEHTQQAEKISPTFAQLYDPQLRVDKKEPTLEDAVSSDDLDQSLLPRQLLLVGDHGLYLMSGGLPGLMINDKGHHYVAYAEGINPEIIEDWYDKKVNIFGGDDGTESIDISWVEQILIAKPKFRYFKIDVTPEQIKLIY